MVNLFRRVIPVIAFAAGAYAGGNFGAYPTYREIDSAVTSLQTRFPAICKRSVLSEKSFQGRDIFLVKVSNSPATANQRPEALISGIQHGDEPIGGIMCLRDIEYLCTQHGRDPEATWLVDNRQIWFIPVMNPDRYVWNESRSTITDRRRKTMRIASGATEINGGVDPNRNYPYRWGYDNRGSGSDPTASNYRGTAALSEPETRAMVDFIASHRIRTWQNHHNSGDYLIVPYGYAGAGRYPADSAIYFTMCREQSRYYRYAKYGNSGDCYGSWILNGGTDDWGTADSAVYGKNYKVYCVITEIGPDPNFYWDHWNDRAKLLARCDSLLGADLYMIKCAGFYPLIRRLRVIDNATGNSDGILNPGETAQLAVTIENKSVVDTTPDVRGVLSTSYAHAGVVDSQGTFGSVRFLSDAENGTDPFTLTCAPTARQGDLVRLNLKVRWRINAVDYEKTLPCSLVVGRTVGVMAGAPERSVPGFRISFDTKGDLVISPILKPASCMTVRVFEFSGRMVRSQVLLGAGKIRLNGDGTRARRGVYVIQVLAGAMSTVTLLTAR
ncbi:MAG: hypothetical protein JXA71_08325 [Chitinispirillaceae bacterium]|nr:hypothetical protein [Chitinispirillaceae bacterium]